MINYEDAVRYIDEIPKFAGKHTLDHTREFLRRLGSPEDGQKIIHVAGTNGKGSVCAYLRAMMMAEGKSVGFFTSPHLVSINERIRINDRQIDDEEFLRAFLKVRHVVDGMNAEGIAHPSYFEFLFGMGMVFFAEKNPDYIILETGLGGRKDATNSILSPAMTIITSISRDHTQYLGDTIEEIAGEKAGIIKENVPLIFDGSCKAAAEVIRKTAEEKQAPFIEVREDAFEKLEITDKHIAFSRRNAYDENDVWHLKNCGLYQMMNASIAISAMEKLINEPHVDRWKDALSKVTWEGRMQEVTEGVFVDGAHNPGAIKAFTETVNALEDKRKPLIILFSAVEDKEYDEMIECLCRDLPVDGYIVTEVADTRKTDVGTLCELFRKFTDRPVIEEPDLDKAWERALAMKGESGRVYCIGSLYLVGMIQKKIQGER